MAKLVVEGQRRPPPRPRARLPLPAPGPRRGAAVRAERDLTTAQAVTGKVRRDREQPATATSRSPASRDPGLAAPQDPAEGPQAAAFIAAMLRSAVAVALVFGIPAITESKEERAAAERRAERQRRGRSGSPSCGPSSAWARARGGRPAGSTGTAAITVRKASASDLAAAVQADAAAAAPGRRVQARRQARRVRALPARRPRRGPGDRPRQPHRPLLVPGHHRRRPEDRDEPTRAASAIPTARC